MSLDPLTPTEIAIAAGNEPGSDDAPPAKTTPAPGELPDELKNADDGYYAPPGDELGKKYDQQASQPEATPITDEPAPKDPEDALLGPEWLTPELAADAGTFGLSPGDIAGLGSSEQVEAHLRLLNVTSANQYRQQQQQQQLPADPPPQQQVPPADAQPARSTAGFNADGTADMEYWKNEYDEDSPVLGLVGALNTQVSTLNSQRTQNVELSNKVDSMMEFMQKSYQVQQENDFMDILDRQEPELFGISKDKSGNTLRLDDNYASNRQKVWNAAEEVQAVMRSQGFEPTSANREAIVRRAIQISMGDELANREMSKRQASLQQHSSRRRPVAGATQTVSEQAPTAMSAEQIANDPAISAFWTKTQQENGTVA
jgi:hypothetical protein